MHFSLVGIMLLFISSCAIFGPPTELDDTKGMNAQRIYEVASEKIADKDYKKAVEYLISNVPELMGNLFCNNYFPETHKTYMNDIIIYILEIIINKIKK